MMRFKDTYLKMTLFYVMIAMTISVVFSLIIYSISAREIGRGFGGQANVMHGLPDDFMAKTFPDLEQARQSLILDSNNHLKLNLFYFNLLILILSSGAGYQLAKKTLQPIEEMVDAQNRFTADASHELRTPLTAMKSEIEVNLRDKNLKINSAKELLQSNLEEIEKLESLSNALLKLARYQDNPDVNFEEISLEDVLVEAYSKVESLAMKKSVKFETKLQDFSIKGDLRNLTELFVIILDNAIKYSPENSKIYITMERDGKHVVVKIKDRGLGIKASDLPYIFNRFYRADDSRSKEKISGYGLGLSIAKRIVELHKGTISVTSKPGKGSEFIVRF